MGITVKESLIHWNYFLALESDLFNASRYIEFSKKNFTSYSIEMARLLLTSASEVDVVLKEICKLLNPKLNAENIGGYRKVITQELPDFAKEKVYIPRFGIELKPWDMWKSNRAPQNPLWWSSYNKVKHQRNDYFEDANLKNVLNSVGGLFVAIFYFYKLKFSLERPNIENRELTLILKPDTSLVRLNDSYYYEYLWD